MELPLPPVELAVRVGVPDPDDPLGSYLRLGRDARDLVLDLLPDGWSFDGKRVLDFGSGAGKVLRHFAVEARVAELHACDRDEPSIDWLRRELCPPFHAFRNDESPPLPVPDGHYDLVLALSVFTHLTDRWSDWLLELHRVLSPDGLLIATFLGRAASEVYLGEPYDEEKIAMAFLSPDQDWDSGGPTVFHSEWWLRAHWGRAFEFLELRPGSSPGEHGIVLLRRRPVRLSTTDLESPEPYELRERTASEYRLRPPRRFKRLRSRLRR
jgi:SAM-dependent methyltransferase